MKIKTPVTLAGLVASLVFGATAFAADVSVKLSNVHLCCESCVRGVERAIAPVSGVTAESDKDSDSVVLSAADKGTVQKAVNALVAAGYFGVSSDPSFKVAAETGAKDAKVQGVEVTGVHLCCKACVTAVNKALAQVPGVTGTTAAKDAETFQVKGDFNQKAVFDALFEAGLAGKVWAAK
ncbi:MAG: hypothetical protein EXS38_03690 [Opitutus sp.]|nr:hypothetical protein [Opitutus sp.]